MIPLDSELDGEVLADEIAHLRSFGWTNAHICQRLNITEIALEQRERRRDRRKVTG